MKRLLCLALLAGCATAPSVTIHADATIGKDLSRAHRHRSRDYEDRDVLVDLLWAVPPPQYPIPQPPPWTPPTPGAPFNPYTPLVNFIHMGPGGQAVTQAHLMQLTPHLLILAPLIQGLTPQQIANTPAAIQAAFAAQAVFAPLGLWTPAVRNWLLANLGQLTTLLNNLYTNLVTPPPPGPTPQPPPFNPPPPPAHPLVTLVQIWNTKDWRKVATSGPGLLDNFLKPAGFGNTELLAFADESGKYDVALWVRQGDVAHSVTRHGYRANRSINGTGEYYLGPEDVSLNYYSLRLSGNDVATDEVYASTDYELLKRVSGGNWDILDRTRTLPRSSAMWVGVDFGHMELRVVAGRTPHQEIGGASAILRYGDGDFLEGHVSLSLLHGDDPMGYVETENRFSTPPLSMSGSGGTASAWGSLTIAMAFLARDGAVWGYQGDVRVIPELHMSLVKGPTEWLLTLGTTMIVAPHGEANLKNPERSLSLVPVRHHVEALVWIYPTDELTVEFGVIIESSRIHTRSRWWCKVGTEDISGEILGELRHNRTMDPDLFFGVGGHLGPTFVRVLSDSGDVQAQAGLDLRF